MANELQQVMSKRDEQQMLDPNMYAPQEVAPLAQQKGIGEQFGDMAKQKAMESALTAGTSGLTAAGTSALGGSAMAGIGTAMPYVGAGMLAGKALGLFNAGGQVGPLSPQYNAEGDKIERNKQYTEDQQMNNYKEMIRQQMYNKSIMGQNPTRGINKLDAARAAFTTDPIMSKMYGVGKAPSDSGLYDLSMFQGLFPIDDKGYTARGYDQGGEVMSEEQAMALMNNQPDPVSNPMPQPRPINFPDPEELLQEMSMTEGAIGTPQVMPAPLSRPVDPMQSYKLEGRDRTYNPYDMIRPDNAPNT